MKNQNNSSMLLVILLIVAFVAAHYLFTFPKMREVETKKASVTAYEQDLERIKEVDQTMTRYEEIKAEVSEEKETLLKDFPSAIYEEIIISKIAQLNTVTDVEKKSNAALRMVGFGGRVETEIVETEEGTSTEDLNIIRNEITLGYKLKYSVLKNMLDTITALQPKATLDALTITKVEGEDSTDPSINAQLKLTFYGYTDGDFVSTETDYKDKFQTLESVLKKANPNILIINPFYSIEPTGAVNTTQTGATQNLSYDFFSLLSPAKYDTPSVTFGKSGDGNKQTSEDKDQVSTIDLVIAKNAQNKYTYKYRVGSMSYPVDYTKTDTFTPANFSKITLEISSQIPAGSADKVGANINISNQSGLPVEVTISNDNGANKRVNVNGNNILTVRK